MKKRVNVYPYLPIRTLKNPIVGNTFNIELYTGEILNCICAKAKVEEILSDGTKILLNLNNYREDFESKIKKVESKPVTNKVPEQPKKHEEPKKPATQPPTTQSKPAETIKPAEPVKQPETKVEPKKEEQAKSEEAKK